jgi:hypothetical protein
VLAALLLKCGHEVVSEAKLSGHANSGRNFAELRLGVKPIAGDCECRATICVIREYKYDV